MRKNERKISFSFSLTNKTNKTIENISKANNMNKSELMEIVIIYLDKNPDEIKKIIDGDNNS